MTDNSSSVRTSVDPRDILVALDAELAARQQPAYTLDPVRSRARLPSELGALLLADVSDPPLQRAFAEGLASVVRAMIEAFPDNLFWDLDLLVASVLREATGQDDPPQYVRASMDRIADLQERFGQSTPIAFRYVHDFLYGYDWARWVARDFDGRKDVGPYSRVFVERMHRRGSELLELIDEGADQTYPKLEGGEVRNPFGFSREPEDELALHRYLAREDLIPVPAWSLDGTPRWERPFGRLRLEAARELGLARR